MTVLTGRGMAADFEMELEAAYRAWVNVPGEMLSVLDNLTDLEASRDRVGADATIAIADLSANLRPTAAGAAEFVLVPPCLVDPMKHIEAAGMQAQFFVGERNNPFFTYYPEEFRAAHPEAFMRDKDGNLIEVVSNPIRNLRNPVPAVDDPTIMARAAELIRHEVTSVMPNPRIRGWMIGSEEAYPDYFALPVGDFRPASMKHFEEWLRLTGTDVDRTPEKIVAPEDSPARAAWYRFREFAIHDRATGHMLAFLDADGTLPVLYPTHGHPFAGDMRRKLGQPPALLVGACDGFELGHIVINEDSESLNQLYLAHVTAFGVPVVAPRLGNKTLDASARGGGRSFTPPMLRRLLYECLGMGVWHIGPIHWRASLGDGEWFIKDTPAEAECAAVFSEIKRLRPVLAGMSRLQPRVGLYVADDTWLEGWNPRWTGLFQDAMSAHWHFTLVGDALLSEELARKMPVLISIENTRVSSAARRGLDAYIAAGGQVLSWGDFGTHDELGRATPSPATTNGGILPLDVAPEATPRTVVNQFQTGDGAWQWPHTFNALPLARVENAVLKLIAPSDLRPVNLKTDSAVTALTLTDGVTLATVLVNRGDSKARVQFSAAEGSWTYRNALAPDDVWPLMDGAAVVELAPYGTSVVWTHPPVDDAASVRDAVAAASSTVETWRALGADTAFVEGALRHAKACLDSESLWPKALAQARLIGRSLALKPAARFLDDGRLDVQTVVFDSAGNPVEGAEARLRVAPGEFGWQRLDGAPRGHYRLELPVDRLPRTYDFAAQTYTPLAGPARIVFSVRRGHETGGAILTVKGSAKE